MRIAVFGTGAVGGYFGGRLALAGADVHLIARGGQLDALRASGLRVRSVRGDIDVALPATDDPAEIGSCDFVLFCVKSYDTVSAAAALAPLLGEETAVVTLQNGVDNESRIAAAVGSGHVMGGVAFILAALEEPGLIVDSGGPGTLAFGELDGTISRRGQRLLDCCQAAGIGSELVNDIEVRLWRKFAFICAQAGMTAATRLPIGDIRAAEPTWLMFRRIVAEVVALASAEGVALPAVVVEQTCTFAESLEPDGFSSLYRDLVKGRRLELEALHGFVSSRSRAHGLNAPMSEVVYALLQPHATRADAAAARLQQLND